MVDISTNYYYQHLRVILTVVFNVYILKAVSNSNQLIYLK